MTDTNGKLDKKKPLTLSTKSPTSNNGDGEGHVRQSFTHGRTKTVTVEVKRKRLILPGDQKEKSGDKATSETTAGLTSHEIKKRLETLQGVMKTKDQEAKILRERAAKERELEETKRQEEQGELKKEEENSLKKEESFEPSLKEAETSKPSEPQHKGKAVYSSYKKEADEDDALADKGDSKLKAPPRKAY